MSLVKIDWRPSSRKLKHFGIAMAVLCAMASAILYYKGHAYTALGLVVFGVAAGWLGIRNAKPAIYVYWLWMGISLVLGLVVSPIVFMLFYYTVITPIGLFMRLIGRDKLMLKRPANAKTYWVDLSTITDRSRYERQF